MYSWLLSKNIYNESCGRENPLKTYIPFNSLTLSNRILVKMDKDEKNDEIGSIFFLICVLCIHTTNLSILTAMDWSLKILVKVWLISSDIARAKAHTFKSIFDVIYRAEWQKYIEKKFVTGVYHKKKQFPLYHIF